MVRIPFLRYQGNLADQVAHREVVLHHDTEPQRRGNSLNPEPGTPVVYGLWFKVRGFRLSGLEV